MGYTNYRMHEGRVVPYGKAEFDNSLSDYDVAVNLPVCVFGKELVEAYPDTRFILTTETMRAGNTTQGTAHGVSRLGNSPGSSDC